MNETAKLIEQRPLIDVDLTVTGNDFGCIDADDSNTRHPIEYGLTENNTWAVEFDYGVVYGRASCQATLLLETVWDYMDANEEAIMAGTKSLDQVRSDLTPIVGATRANYMATFIAKAIDGTGDGDEELFKLQMVFSFSEDASFNTSDTGPICYCQMTGFLSEPRDEESGTYAISRAVAVESAPWVFDKDYSSADTCAKECPYRCTQTVKTGDNSFRKMIFGGYRVADASTCDANEIEIRWTDAAEEDIAATNAGMCTYGGDIRTPLKAATIPGKTFVGWKFLPQEH